MPRYRLIALSNAKEGREADFNAWYDNVHMPDMLKIPGIVSGERFVNVLPAAHKFIAIYDIDTDDLGAVAGELQARAGTDRMMVSDSIDTDTALMNFCAAHAA